MFQEFVEDHLIGSNELVCIDTNESIGNELLEFVSECRKTDQLYDDDLTPVQQGLFGEVGSVLATVKKFRREQRVFTKFRETLCEDFGDVLWYFAALCRRIDVDTHQLMLEAAAEIEMGNVVVSKSAIRQRVEIDYAKIESLGINELVLSLGRSVAELLNLRNVAPRTQQQLLHRFARDYLNLVKAFEYPFQLITMTNLRKTSSRFHISNNGSLPTFDFDFQESEQLPFEMRFQFVDSKHGQCKLFSKGKQVGQSLTDNIKDRDGYRFHDVFHIAYASILHWSPVVRKMLGCKRKSDSEIDETEDGGRAAAIEEGVSAYIFSYAKELNFFLGQDELSFDLLKTIQKFVSGFEVDQCPLSQWEKAILQGYEVFRQLVQNSGGTVFGCRKRRTIKYEAPPRKRRH